MSSGHIAADHDEVGPLMLAGQRDLGLDVEIIRVDTMSPSLLEAFRN